MQVLKDSVNDLLSDPKTTKEKSKMTTSFMNYHGFEQQPNQSQQMAKEDDKSKLYR
jgi:hypothetical protein